MNSKNLNEIKLQKNYVIGKCMEMCPEPEIRMYSICKRGFHYKRERERLLHPFEILNGTEKDRLPKADKTRTVKSFARSAAGKLMQDPKNLRPPEVLQKTVNYLLSVVISRKDVQWRVVYDFVMDRLRSVRQDMVIQNISRTHQLVILHPIVRFLAYSSYRLCEESSNNFDPHINDTHLQECLKRLLCMYDQLDELKKSKEDKENHDYSNGSRSYFEALYIVFNLGNTIAITRALNLPLSYRNPVVQLALEISLSHVKNNFVRVCRLIENLPPLLASVAYLHMPSLRRTSLKIMSNAYNSKNLTLPVAVLQKVLLYNNEDEVVDDCNYYGLKVNVNGVIFLKNDFDFQKPVVNQKRRSLVIDKKLNNLKLSTLVLFGE